MRRPKGFSMRKIIAYASLCLGLLLPLHTPAQTIPDGMTAEQISTHMGEMRLGRAALQDSLGDRLIFEPFQMLEEFFLRDDVVFLMRHGPTDWSKLDIKNVAPTDCANQRVMTPQGMQDMRNLGTLLASNGILPSQIVRSEWCRNEQTLRSLLDGFARVDATRAAQIPVEVDGELNLLLSLQGAEDVTKLQARVDAWQGDPDRKGPLLIVTHFTNIQELTQFGVFEGEILVVDPKRDNRVLGYLRLASSGPDVGHFKEALDSPLMSEDAAVDMLSRYYDALNRGDAETIANVLSDRWTIDGRGLYGEPIDQATYQDQVRFVQEALGGASFRMRDLFYSDGVATVLGTIRGRHTGELFGIAPTGVEVAFDMIEVHRIEEGEIVETWGMADRLDLQMQLEAAARQ